MRIEALLRACLGAAVACGLLAAASGAAAASAPSGEPSPASSVSGQAYEKFLATAERLYEAVNGGQLEAAVQRLGELERQLRSLPMKTIATAEGIRALAGDVAEMKRTVAALSPDEAKWKKGAASLRLAADALAHPDKPIWHRYRTVLQEDINKLAAAVESGTAKQGGPPAPAVRAAFEPLAEHYGLIRTAALLRAEPWKIERIDSALRYASRIYEAQAPKPELVRGTLEPIREALRELFPEGGGASETLVPPLGAVPPSWGWSAMMGTFIVTILTWVGWKRYKLDDAFGGSGDAYRRDDREDAAERLLGRWRKKK
ncbi:sporulation protein YpjB [Cohnella cellulosilytica]|uniref:Sporulation protein YpjB n=2 Tax=Cohnella cellulosilytica TaxID=986710 RepID=A0ABW2F2B3_9BACL